MIPKFMLFQAIINKKWTYKNERNTYFCNSYLSLHFCKRFYTVKYCLWDCSRLLQIRSQSVWRGGHITLPCGRLRRFFPAVQHATACIVCHILTLAVLDLVRYMLCAAD